MYIQSKNTNRKIQKVSQQHLSAWGCFSVNVGDNNTVKGAISHFYKNEMIHFPEDEKDLESFLFSYLKNNAHAFLPDFLFFAFDGGNNDSQKRNNALSWNVKKILKYHFNHTVKTISLSDKNTNNPSFDYTQIPNFLLSAKEKVKSNHIIYTDSIVHNVNLQAIDQAFNDIKKLSGFNVLYKSKKPIILYVLGGETRNKEISFIINFKNGIATSPEVERLFREIKHILKNHDVNIVIGTSHRTPSAIVDMIFELVEKMKSNRLFFYNGKPLPEKEGKIKAWNQYDGKYFDYFKNQRAVIFPGILKLNPLFIMTTVDSQMACECLNNGYRTGILDYFPGQIEENKTVLGAGRPDCKRFYRLMKKKEYLFDYKSFLKDGKNLPIECFSSKKILPLAIDDVLSRIKKR